MNTSLHDSIGYFDLQYLQEDMMDCNRKIICEKHQKYWWEQHQRDLNRKLTQCCVNGDDDHKNCGMASCECHCHYNQFHNGRSWFNVIICKLCNSKITTIEFGQYRCTNMINGVQCSGKFDVYPKLNSTNKQRNVTRGC